MNMQLSDFIRDLRNAQVDLLINEDNRLFDPAFNNIAFEACASIQQAMRKLEQLQWFCNTHSEPKDTPLDHNDKEILY